MTFIVGIYYGEYLRSFSLDPWYNQWERDTIQYLDPSDIWFCYIWLSFIISFWLVYPSIGIHYILFISNRLFYSELKRLYIYWFTSILLLFITWFILIYYQIIGILRDISHFDEDINLVYVPNIKTYINNWVNFLFIFSLLSQIPLIWLKHCIWSIRRTLGSSEISSLNKLPKTNNIYSNRIIFTLIFILPSFISAIILFDDLILQIIWIIIIRITYIMILYSNVLYYFYNKIYFNELTAHSFTQNLLPT